MLSADCNGRSESFERQVREEDAMIKFVPPAVHAEGNSHILGVPASATNSRKKVQAHAPRRLYK